ncbi:MAG: hypothetical protein ACI9FB_000612 [Candidatus Azotimanducaceae bacterium]|jgi:hypothetical protein
MNHNVFIVSLEKIWSVPDASGRIQPYEYPEKPTSQCRFSQNLIALTNLSI